MPVIKLESSSVPVEINVPTLTARPFVKPVIVCRAVSASVGRFRITPSCKDVNSFPPSSMNRGRPVSNTPMISSGTFPRICVTIGIKLPNSHVDVVVASASNCGPISSPIDIAPSRLVNDAFIDANDPASVSLASFAVVPVIPSSPCTAWIAL